VTTPTLEEYPPYKGPESYQVEDAAFFFGRHQAADQIVAHILSAQVSLLHAQSGAGKTSLLNALVIPQLEEHGWTPVRILPQDDPVRATRIACLQAVVPPPEAEALALRRALDGLFGAADDPTLDELLARYDDPAFLPVRDPRKRCLISPVPLAGDLGARYPALDGGRVTPYVCRLLRSSLDLPSVADHLAAIGTACGTGSDAWQPVRGDTRVRQLLHTLRGDACRAAYAATLDYLDLPVRELRPFIENLLRIYGSVRPGLCLVLLFDQFEELFTRFVDPGSLHAPGTQEMPDWRLRVEFIEELRSLCRNPPATTGERAAGRRPQLPVRHLISMRSEYIAQLRPIREFAPEIDRSTCQLELLTQASARQAIEEPAVLFGYTYEEECFNQILADLLKEERYIEPAHLSLVCEKLWQEAGRNLVRQQAQAAGGLPTVPLATYAERLHGARGILRDFLQDFLGALADDDERREALELIEPLITGSGTRNIVERRQLLQVPFRDATRRKELLDKLVNRTLVRIEPRLGGQFIEITHEFLIPAVQEALRKYLYGNVEYQQFRAALRALAESETDRGSPATESVINRAEFGVLDRHRQRVQWNGWAIEQMLRAWLCHGAGGEQRATLRYWLDATSGRASASDLGTIRQSLACVGAGQGFLSRQELQQINANRDRQPFTPAERQAILRSALLRATAEENADVRYWTLQVMQ